MSSKSKQVLRKAAVVWVENLEERRMFSALVPGSTVLTFNDSTPGGSGATPGNVDVLKITNTGPTTLTFGGGAFSIVADPSDSAGDESAEFSITSGTPSSLAAGQSAQISVQYTASVANTVQEALLQITASDSSVTSIQLHGLGTNGYFGTDEPSLANVLRANDIPTIVGAGPNDSDASNSQYPETPDPSSQEVPLQRLVKAGSGPVTITPLASFNSSVPTTVIFGDYVPGDPTDTTQLFTIGQAGAQTVNPTALGATSFDPGSSEFGLYATFPGTSTPNNSVDTHYSEDALNTLDPTHSRKFRFFPMENADGTVVPNTYIVAAEDYNDPSYNSFVNFVGIISNVEAAPGAPNGAVLGLTNLSGAPSSTQLAFNRIQNLNPADPSGFVDQVHDTNVLQINNTGNQTLNISSLTLSDTTNWEIVNPPSLPATVAPGGTLDITIKFIATTNPSHTDNQTNDTATTNGISSVAAGGTWYGTLTIGSNDAARPFRTVNLAGYWQDESENENEPSLQTITNLLFGYTTEIASSQMDEYPNAGTNPVNYGEEVDSALWDAADPTMPVTVLQLAAFHNQWSDGVEPATSLFYYPSGTSNFIELFQDQPGHSQSLFPTISGSNTTIASASFTPGGTFGWNIDGENSNNSSNTTDITTYDRSGHAVRFYPIRNAQGNVVPNEWLMVMDYENSEFDNSDFQDNMFLVTNMKPHAATAAPSSLAAVAAAGSVSLEWAPVSDGSLQGYNVYRTTSIGGTETLLNGSPLTSTSYVDTTAPADATVYYTVTTVNGSLESRGIGTSVATPLTTSDVLTSQDINALPGGSTTIVTPGSAYTITGGGADIGGSTADGFRYAYEQVTGDFDVSVQVASISQNVNSGSRGGLMVKDSLDPSGRMIFAGVNATTGYRFNYRTTAGADGVFTSGSTPTFPDAWVRIVRSGNVFTAYSSPDGATWTQIGTLTLALPSTVYLGLAVSSHDTQETATAQFQNFAFAGSSAPVLTPPAGLTATGTSSAITLQWSAEAAATGGYNVFRSDSANGTFTQLNSSGLTTTTYVDSTAPQGATSYYEVVALDSSGNSSSPSTTSALRPNASTSLTFGGKTVATYVDDAGHTVKLQIVGKGSGTATFIDGALTPGSITLSGTTAGSTFKVTVVGGTTNVGTIAVSGSLGTLSAPAMVVQGDIAISGTLGTLTIAGANGGHTLSVGAGAHVASLNLGQVSDLSITSAAAITVIRDTAWVTSGASTLITAPSIGTLNSAGEFSAGLDLSASGRELGTATIRGALDGEPWTLNGNAGQIVAAGVAAGWTGTIRGTVTALRSTGDFAGELTASTLGTIRVSGDLTGTITATGGSKHDIQVLNVLGAINGGQVLAAGSIGSVSAAELLDANVFAGVSSSVTALPTTASDFTAASTITSVVVTGKNHPFAVQASNVAASKLGRVNFGPVNTDNGGVQFGLATNSLASFTRKVNGTTLVWTSHKDPSLLGGTGDLVVNLF